jgi:Ran GTPase-activating protein (RanGAP) involved in mRNA processing and transport
MDKIHLFERLAQNDKTLRRLRISSNVENGESFFPRKNYDWMELGKHLGQNETITELSISFPDTTRDESDTWLDCLSHGLKNNRSIKLLSFRNIRFARGSSFFVKLGRFWSWNQFLYCIRFNFCAIDIRECTNLARAITLSSSIQNIIIRNTRLQVDNLLAISPALHGWLDSFRLCNCGIDDCHIKALSDLWVMENKTPSSVDLSGNRNITAASCGPLSQVIKSINSLSLSNTSIGDNGIVALFQTYDELSYHDSPTTSNLRILNLEGSNLTDSACRTLRLVLRRQEYSITKLNLNSNNISDKGMKLLVKGLKGNTSLDSLHLDKNRITQKGWQLVLNLVCNVSTIDATKQSNHTLATLTGPPNDFWKTNLGSSINSMLSINKQAARKVRRGHRMRVTGRNAIGRRIAAATKITNEHLVDLYKSSSTILNCDDDNLFPLIIAWIANHHRWVLNWYDAKIAFTAMNHLVQHKCNLFQTQHRYKGTRVISKHLPLTYFDRWCIISTQEREKKRVKLVK